MDMEEMLDKLRKGEPLYGHSSLDPYHQKVAASQSRWAQLKFRMSLLSSDLDIFPFFNFANHSDHGVPIEKYWNALPEKEREQLFAKQKEKVEKLRDTFEQGKDTEIKFVNK